MEDNENSFITLYLNVNANHFLDQQEQNRIFLKNSFASALKTIKEENNKEILECFNKNVKKIDDYLEEDLSSETHGIAFFACCKLGLFEVFESRISFDNEFILDSFPHLKQLLYVNDEYEKTLVILLNSHHSEIFDVRLGGYLSQRKDYKASFDADVKGFHKQGGWAQSKFQRGIKQEKEWHYSETALKTAEIFDSENYDNVIIVGIDNIIENFIKYLPKRISDKIIDTESYAPEDNINTLMEKIVADLHKREKTKEFDIVKEIIEKACSHDGGCLGLDETIELATQGRIDTLVVIKEDRKMGFKSGECLYSEKGQKKPGCDECNGNCKDTDLIEELIRMTVKNGGKIELLDKETLSGNEMEKHGGIGAILRY